MRTQVQYLDFHDLMARGDWDAAAEVLGVLPERQIAQQLEALDAPGRSYLFSRLPSRSWLSVYAQLSPAKQNRELAVTIASLRS